MPNLTANANFQPGVFTSETLAGIRSIEPSRIPDKAVCLQLGNAAAWDQALAIWTFDSGAEDADNGTAFLKPTLTGASDPGRWRKPA